MRRVKRQLIQCLLNFAIFTMPIIELYISIKEEKKMMSLKKVFYITIVMIVAEIVFMALSGVLGIYNDAVIYCAERSIGDLESIWKAVLQLSNTPLALYRYVLWAALSGLALYFIEKYS